MKNRSQFSLTLGNGNRANKKGQRKRPSKRKRLHQSDTETRKLLDDVGDADDDYVYLEEMPDEQKIDPQFFEMSDAQTDYYTKCFLHLQRKTQGQASMSGAVSGADDRVVDFFRKSQLDNRTLSRVWGLADVNEDGFLNHSEFVLAMHLIVLHVKGRVPVPSRLPSPVRPCPTPTRLLQALVASDLQNSTASSTLSSAADNASTSRVSDPAASTHVANLPANQYSRGAPHQTSSSQQPSSHFLQASTSSYPIDESAQKHHSLSDDHLHVHGQREVVVADFSDAPPLLVDSRPTALNATTSSAGIALLNSLASRGPPPRPPPRQYNDSAKGHGRSVSLDLNTLPTLTNQLYKPPPSMFHSATTAAPPPPPPPHATTISSSSNQTAPLPPQLWQTAPQLSSKSTQTDALLELSSSRQPSLDENAFAALLEGAQKMSPEERCRVLRALNADLENERVTLSQVRLQLQLRLEEAELALQQLGIRVTSFDQVATASAEKAKKAPHVASPKPTEI